jgi:hypothetical protein
VSDASITISGTGVVSTTLTIKVLHVALIPWALVFGMTGGVLWWKLPQMYPRGHCAACGYDLAGSSSGKCPECGRAASRILAG